MKKIEKVISILTSIVSTLSYLGFLAVMVLIVVDVVMGKVTGGVTRVIGAYEIIQYLLLCGVFASFAYTQSLHGHVHVTMLISKFPQKLRFLIYGITYILSAATAALLTYAAAAQANYSISAGTKTGVLGIPLFPFFWVECFCMAIFAITLVWDVIKSFIAMFNKEVAEEIQSTWA